MLPTWWFSVIHVEEALISRLLRIYWLTMPGLLIKRVWKKWRVPWTRGFLKKNILEIMPVGQGCVPIQLLFHLCVQRTMSVPLILLIIVSSRWRTGRGIIKWCSICMVVKKDTISLRTGWLYNSMRMVMRWLRMQRLMSPIGVKITCIINLL